MPGGLHKYIIRSRVIYQTLNPLNKINPKIPRQKITKVLRFSSPVSPRTKFSEIRDCCHGARKYRIEYNISNVIYYNIIG